MLGGFVTLLLLLSTPVLAQTVAIRAGHLVDPATGRVTDDQAVLVRDGRIVEVGPSVEIPQGAAVVDLTNSWVFPGLMDAHTHLAMGLPPAPPGESLWEIYLLKESTAFRTALAIHHARVLLEGGFTTVRDIGNEGDFAMTAVRQAQAEGWVTGPTIFSAGKIIAPFGGQSYRIAPEQGPFWHYEYFDADTPDEIPPPKILKCMTTNVAELLWIDDERGAIKAGLAADIVATPENPLENIHTLREVHFVMKDGEVIKHSK